MQLSQKDYASRQGVVMSKYTSGPWISEVYPEDDSIVITSEARNKTSRHQIATIVTGFKNERFEIEQVSNAALIATAPELLEDLEYRYSQTKCGCGHPACNRCQDDKQTEAVIAKAKGEL